LVEEKKIKQKKKLGNYPSRGVVLSNALALFVIGLLGLVILFAERLSEIVKEKVEIQVFLHKHITENERIKIGKVLASKPYVAHTDGISLVEFVPKEEAAKQFIEETGEDFINFLGENPLRDAYVIKLKSEFIDNHKMAGIKKEIEKISGVFEVSYVENFVSSITKNFAKISLVLLAFAMVLFFTVSILIKNTIKLALFSQRFLIRSMQLVGAKAGFIRKPFLLRSILHGIFSGVIAVLLLYGFLSYGNQHIEDLMLLQDPVKIYTLMGILPLTGAVICLLSTYIAINKYMSMSLDELY
jgi:cell division transport system permease protein